MWPRPWFPLLLICAGLLLAAPVGAGEGRATLQDFNGLAPIVWASPRAMEDGMRILAAGIEGPGRISAGATRAAAPYVRCLPSIGDRVAILQVSALHGTPIAEISLISGGSTPCRGWVFGGNVN